jgi:hypothetical protein
MWPLLLSVVALVVALIALLHAETAHRRIQALAEAMLGLRDVGAKVNVPDGDIERRFRTLSDA